MFVPEEPNHYPTDTFTVVFLYVFLSCNKTYRSVLAKYVDANYLYRILLRDQGARIHGQNTILNAILAGPHQSCSVLWQLVILRFMSKSQLIIVTYRCVTY